MATQKQIEANRRNAQKSTGPRTGPGKDSARANALVHGLRAGTIEVLPHEDPALFQDRIEAFFADYDPTDRVEAHLVRHAAVLSWKIERVDRHEKSSLSRRVREAMERAQLAARDRLADAIEGLVPEVADGKVVDLSREPAGELLETIEGSAAGCRWLLGRWRGIRAMIAGERLLIDEFEMEATRLLGSGPARIGDPRALDFVVAARMAWSWSPGFEPPRELTGPCGSSLDRGRLREAWFRRPGSQADAVTSLMAITDGEIARLEGVLAARGREGDAGLAEIVEAAEIASFDPGAEGERLRRYQAALHREFLKTIDAISKRRQQAMRSEPDRAKPGVIGADGADSAESPVAEAVKSGAEMGAGSGGTPRVPAPLSANEADPTDENGANKANSPPAIGANEPNVPPEIGANEANPTPQTATNEPKMSRRRLKRMMRRRRSAA